MSKNLIICEKPSLARNVCNGLKLNGETFTKKDNYYESNNYMVTAVFGHLFSLYDIDDYLGEKTKWDLNQLPYVPDSFSFKLKEDYKTKKPDTGIKKQFELIKSLIHSDIVSSITNCGDSDREGEIIIRIVLEEANNTKPVYRLWLPEQTEETIAKEIQNMKPDSAYDNLASEGYARMFVDWLYGINFTRYATVKSGTLLRLGRVITPIVKTIYERDKEIENFVAVPYYQLLSKEKTNDVEVELLVKEKYQTRDDPSMLELLEKLNSNPSLVSKIEKKERVIQSPKLFSQSDLQNFLSKKYKYAPSETLKLTQSLYEKGYISYPRTPTNYLSENEKEKVQEIITVIRGQQEKLIIFKDNKRIFDDSKIESHSAIIPTKKLPDLNSLSEKERNCYQTIYHRFCAVFCAEDHRIAETIITITNSGIDFELKGAITLTEGFLAFERPETNKEVKQLPNVTEGDNINSHFKVTEKMTSPPKHWTVETLNNFLKNPFRKESDSEDEDYKNMLKGLEIGTEATRSGIIDNAIKSEYINLKKSTYTIAEKGRYLIETINKLGIDLDTSSTALLGGELKKVYLNEKEIPTLLDEVRTTLETVMNKDISIEKHIMKKEVISSCPLCGMGVIENNKAFTCEDRACRFTIWKDTNFITKIGKKKLTKKIVSDLCISGKTEVKGLTSKAGKKYDCTCELEIGEKYINIKPVFNH